jgi:CBS domain-containing protein
MIKEVLSARGEISVSDASKLMVENDQWYVIVLKAGSPVGIVTEKDFVSKVLSKDLKPKKVRLFDIMSSPLVTVDPDADLSRATGIMKEKRVRKLPVVKDSVIYGVITARDVISHFEDYVNKSIREIITYTFPLRF